MLRSRLSRRTEEKTKKNLIFSIFGIILVLFLIFKFGIPFLIGASSLLSGSGNNEILKIQGPNFIAPPILEIAPEATSSSNITIKGLVSKKQKVDLYLNDNLINSTQAGDDGKFSFDEVLKPGENTIKTKAIVDNKESDYSNILTIVLKNAPPSLTITSPSDNQSFSRENNSIEVAGTTDPDVKVIINGFWAIIDANGNFSYNLLLQNGENKIKITATDLAGNKTEKEIKVTYSS